MFNDLMDTIGFVEEKDPEVGQAMSLPASGATWS